MEISRIIVKNIPTIISEKQLKEHFSKMGEITDVKIIFKNQKNRRFCFIGFKLPEQAKKAKEYFNNTYINTSKISVELAQTKDSKDLPQPFSKYSKGSKEYNKSMGIKFQSKLKKEREGQEELTEEEKKQQEIIEKQKQEKLRKFKEFSELMKLGSVSTMSWNDVVVEGTKGKEAKGNKKKQEKLKQKLQEQQDQNMQSLDQFEKDRTAKPSEQKESNQPNEKKEQVKSDQAKPLSPSEETTSAGKKPVDDKRLYITNLPFTISEDEVRQIFQKFGKIEELKLPKGKGGQFTGYAFLTYSLVEEALRAFVELDNKIVFGRILHVRPAFQDTKTEQKKFTEIKVENLEIDREKSSYKKQKKAELKRKLKDETNWNTLFLNPNTILESIGSKFSLKKSEILSLEDDDLAVRVANAETQIINETKKWMLDQGLNLDFLEKERQSCERSKTVILAKNLAFSVTEEEIRDLFSYYGIVLRVMLCPNRSIAIIEYQDEQNAENGFNNLQQKPHKHNPLYLEWAPVGILDKKQSESQKPPQPNASSGLGEDSRVDEADDEKKLSCILYVKNLNYETTEQALKQHVSRANVGDIRSVKIIKKKDGTSYGYGFIEFSQPEGVINAIKSLQGKILDGHALQLSLSKREKDDEGGKKQKKNKQRNTEIEAGIKIIVRNVAFEATKKDIRQLFKTYGELKAVRLPKKLNGQHRGFGFVEFVSTEEAKNAFVSLENTHLYGRKLVIEWAKQDQTLADD